jgi:hypothetical protein
MRSPPKKSKKRLNYVKSAVSARDFLGFPPNPPYNHRSIATDLIYFL